jgi:hypothetical protein
VQKLLVGADLCDGPISHHHDLVSLGQDVECMGHEDPSLVMEGGEVTRMLIFSWLSAECLALSHPCEKILSSLTTDT